jgi:hypothetical protein
LRIDPGQARQSSRVQAIVFAPALSGDGGRTGNPVTYQVMITRSSTGVSTQQHVCTSYCGMRKKDEKVG